MAKGDFLGEFELYVMLALDRLRDDARRWASHCQANELRLASHNLCSVVQPVVQILTELAADSGAALRVKGL